MALGGVVLPTRAARLKQKAERLGLVRLMALGWEDGPLLVCASSEARRGEAVRKERRRAETMARREGARVVLEWCVADPDAVKTLRRRVQVAHGSVVVSGEMYAVDSASLERAIRSEAASMRLRLMADAERADLLARAMERA